MYFPAPIVMLWSTFLDVVNEIDYYIFFAFFYYARMLFRM